jgi:hypothetical protein
MAFCNLVLTLLDDGEPKDENELGEPNEADGGEESVSLELELLSELEEPPPKKPPKAIVEEIAVKKMMESARAVKV